MNGYDETPYRGAAFPRTHVDHLATLATIFGMTPAGMNGCRVLELGCGDGGNLIPMAFSLPQSQFLGIDLAATAIATARATAQRLKIGNCNFEALDLTKFPKDGGSFDFIIAQGVYSWVPEAVRERILAICRDHLAPQGVAFISYNAYPGGYLRQMTRSMMLYHTRSTLEAEKKVKQGRTLLRFALEAQPETGTYRSILEDEVKRLEMLEIGGIYHDDFSPDNVPFYFHQFAADAGRHGLQFLCEADLFEMETGQLPEPTAAKLRALDRDILAREQYLDLIKGRFFRQTLVCHSSVVLDRSFNPSRVETLYASSAAAPTSPQPNLAPGVPEEFRIANGVEVTTTSATAKAALLYLSEIWPRMAGLVETDAAARERLAQSGIQQIPVESLPALLLRMNRIGLVNFRTQPPALVERPGPRPAVSELVRTQAKNGGAITSLLHGSVQLESAFMRKLVPLLDGTRDRSALLEALNRLFQSNELVPDKEGVPIRSADEASAHFAAALDPALAKLARAALLVA